MEEEQFKEEDILRTEFEQQIDDDEDFKEQWGEADEIALKKRIKEYLKVLDNGKKKESVK